MIRVLIMLENIILTIGLIIILMLLDYFLTLKGLKAYKKSYSKFVEFESYELNPIVKESISKGVYNLKHLLSMVLVSLLVYVVHYLSFNNLFGFQIGTFFFTQGMIFSMGVYMNSRHIQNLIIFNWVDKDPSMLSGKIKQKNIFSLKALIAQSIGLFLILIFIFIFVQNMFTLGFSLGPLIVLLKTRSWIKTTIFH